MQTLALHSNVVVSWLLKQAHRLNIPMLSYSTSSEALHFPEWVAAAAAAAAAAAVPPEDAAAAAAAAAADSGPAHDITAER